MDGLMDNLNIQEEIEVPMKKKIRRKNSYSKIFEHLLECLEKKKHAHMLKSLNEKEFVVTLKNMKSPDWSERDVSLFKELDEVQENKKRSKENYEEKSKGRFRANMHKLDKYIKLKKIEKDSKNKSITRKTYEIIWPKYIAGLRMSRVSSEERYINVENGFDALTAVETSAPNVLIPEYANPNMNVNENGIIASNIHMDSTDVFIPSVQSFENENIIADIKGDHLNSHMATTHYTLNTLIAENQDLETSKENGTDNISYLNNESEFMDIKGSEDNFFENFEDLEVNDWNVAEQSIFEKMTSKNLDKEHGNLEIQDMSMYADENNIEDCSNLQSSFTEKLFNCDFDFNSLLL